MPVLFRRCWIEEGNIVLPDYEVEKTPSNLSQSEEDTDVIMFLCKHSVLLPGMVLQGRPQVPAGTRVRTASMCMCMYEQQDKFTIVHVQCTPQNHAHTYRSTFHFAAISLTLCFIA